MQQTSGAGRLLVWDSLAEWTRKRRVQGISSLDALAAWVKADLRGEPAPPAGYTGPVTREHFEVFCRLAWVWIRHRKGSVLVIEELADVTWPGRAPAAWGEICRKGRHHAAAVYAITQRPAESDKTIAGNAAVIHAGLMALPRDRAFIAQYLDVPAREVEQLAPLEWIERDMRTRELRRGRVSFR
jgi:hypothetical protein